MIRPISRLAFLLFLIGILFNTTYAQVDISSSNNYIDCKLIDKYKTNGAYFHGHGIFSPTNRCFIFEAYGNINIIDLNLKQVIKTKPRLQYRTLQFINDSIITANQAVSWGTDYRILITYDLNSNKFISEKRINTKKYSNESFRYQGDKPFVFSKDRTILAAVFDYEPQDQEMFDLKRKFCIAISSSNGTLIRYKDYGYPGEKTYSIDISPNNKYIVAGGENKKIKIWEIEKGLSIKTIHTYGDITSICFHPSGDFMACGDMNGKIYLISTDNWEIIKSFTPSSINGITDIEFDPKGYLLSCLIDNELLFINAFSENELVNKFSDAKKKLIFLTYSNDGHELMAVGRDRYVYHYHLDYSISESFAEILNQQAKFLNKLLYNGDALNSTKYYVVDTKPINKDQFENKNNLVVKVQDELKIQFAENSLDYPTLLKVSKLDTNPDVLNSSDYYPVSPIFEISCSEKSNKPFQVGLKLSDNNLDEQDTVFVGRISNGKLELLNTVYDINSDYYFAESNEFSFWGLFTKKKPRFKFVTVTPLEYSGIEPRGIEDYDNCNNYNYDNETENFKEDLVIKCGVIDEQSKIKRARLKVKVHGNVEWAYDMIQKVVLSYTNIGYNQILTAPILNRKQSHQSMYIDAYFPTEGKTENQVSLHFYEFTISKEDLSNILCGVSWINSIDLQVLLLDDEGKVKRESEIKSINFNTENKPQISLVYPNQKGNSQQFFLWSILNNDNSVDFDYQFGEFKIFIDTDDNPYDGGWLAFEEGTSSLPTAEYFNHDPIRVNYRNSSTNKLERGIRYYWGVTISKRNSNKKEDIVYSGVESFYVDKNVFLTNPTKNYTWNLKDYNQKKIVSCDFKDYTGRVAIEIIKHNDLQTLAKRLFRPNFNESIDIAYDLGELDEGIYKIKLKLMDIQAMPYGYSETFIIKNKTKEDNRTETYVQETKQEEKMTDGEFLMQLAGNVVVNHINNKINDRIDEYQNSQSKGNQNSSDNRKSNHPNVIGTWVGIVNSEQVTIKIYQQENLKVFGRVTNSTSSNTWGFIGELIDSQNMSNEDRNTTWIETTPGRRYILWFDIVGPWKNIAGRYCGSFNSAVNNFSGKVYNDLGVKARFNLNKK